MKRWMVLGMLLTLGAGMTLADSSEQNRASSTVFLGISPFGIHLPTLAAPPVGIGVYLGSNFIVAVEGGTQTYEFEDGDDTAEATFSNVGAYARWFPGTNSFNVLLGVHQRAWDASGNVTIDDDSGVEVKVKGGLQADATVVTVGIGNQWMADFGLTWGFDWLVASGVAGSSVTTKVKGSASGIPLTSDQTKDADKALQDLGTLLNQASGTPGLLIFTIGWSF